MSTKQFNVRLPVVLWEWLDSFSLEVGMSKTDIVTDALQSIKDGRASLVPNPFPPEANMVNLDVVCEGRTLPVYAHQGQFYAEAPSEGEYTIRMRNTTGQRLLVVLSVDGLSVLDGKEASFDRGGYVLGPYQTSDIKGWLRNGEEAAAFKFGAIDESYSAQMGKGKSNVGVIGLAIFSEKPKPRRSVADIMGGMELESHWSGGPFGAQYSVRGATKGSPVRRRVSASVETNASIGTGYGSKVEMHTTETTFERASTTPIKTVALRYATRAKLEEWGVPVTPVGPNPFPGVEASVPAPPGWRG